MPRTSTLWFVSEPQPLHHVTVVKRFQEMPEGFTARVLILRRAAGTVEPYLPLIKYQRAYPHHSSSWQNKVVRAMGLFWDYCIVSKDSGLAPRDLFRHFALALLAGTIKANGDDHTGLLWPTTSRERAIGLVKSIEAFSEWCCSEDAFVPSITPVEIPLIPGTGEHVTSMLVWSRLRKASMLQHIKREPKTSHKSVVDHGRDTRGHDAEPVKFFPPADAERLLWMDGGIICESEIRKIEDTTLRHQVLLLFGQNRSLHNQLNILKQDACNAPIQIAGLPSIAGGEDLALTPAEVDAVRDFIDPRKLRAKHLAKTEDDGVSTRDGRAIADPGFITALEKISKSYQRP